MEHQTRCLSGSHPMTDSCRGKHGICSKDPQQFVGIAHHHALVQWYVRSTDHCSAPKHVSALASSPTLASRLSRKLVPILVCGLVRLPLCPPPCEQHPMPVCTYILSIGCCGASSGWVFVTPMAVCRDGSCPIFDRSWLIQHPTNVSGSRALCALSSPKSDCLTAKGESWSATVRGRYDQLEHPGRSNFGKVRSLPGTRRYSASDFNYQV